MENPFPTPTATPPGHSQTFKITKLKTPREILTHQPQLCQILRDCVNEGTSIGFLAPLSLQDAEIYWTQVADLINDGNLHLFILTADSSPTNHVHTEAPSSSSASTIQESLIIFGTVQLLTIPKTTHLHRAEVVKLLVAPSARRLGIASRLMSHIEDFARGIGRDLLTLDTATESPAMGMYRRLGWEEWGTCKGYASWPDGSRCDATFFRREL